MNEKLAIILICIGGFLAMFLPLYLFADPGISPLYGGAETRVALDAQNTRSYAQEIRNAEEVSIYADSEQYAEETRQNAPELSVYEEVGDWQPETEEARTGEIDAQDTREEDQEEEQEDEQEDEEELQRAAFLAALQYLAIDTLGENGEIYRMDDAFVVNYWQDGLAELLIAGRLAQGETPDEWVAIRQRFQTVNMGYFQQMFQYGLVRDHMVFNLISDHDHDVSLLQVVDGAIEYDFLETDADAPLYIERP